MVIGSQAQTHLTSRSGYSPIWYVSDLPGCDGTKPNRTLPNSDWGWETDRAKAISLSPYWQRRFIKYGRDVNRVSKLEVA